MIPEHSHPDQITWNDKNHVTLELDTIRELLIAPDFDPFSEKETEYMGQSAVERLMKQLKPGWMLRRRKFRLTILLPRAQITPGIQEQVTGAIHRYCVRKITDNTILIRNIQWRGYRQLPFSFAFLAFCLGMATFFGSGVVAGIPAWLGSVLNNGFQIIGWVSLWGPTETLLFDPLPVRRENNVLRVLMEIPIEILPRE
jgi:hypothetical protein